MNGELSYAKRLICGQDEKSPGVSPTVMERQNANRNGLLRQKGGTDIKAIEVIGRWCLLLGVIVAISPAFAWDGLLSIFHPN